MVKNKRLKKKAEKALEYLNKIRFCNWAYDLQIEIQNPDTKQNLYSSIDELKKFIDNIN